MNRRLLQSASLLSTLLALSACCRRPESGSPDVSLTPPSTPGQPGATAGQPGSPKPKSRPLAADKIATMTKQIAAGHTVHPPHSFEVSLKGFDGSMLATTGPNKTTFVFHFFDASDKRVTSVFDKELDSVEGVKLLAVAFEDVDRDGREDLVVLATYLAAKSDYNAVSVYTRAGGGTFRFQEKLGARAGNVPSMAAALAKLR